MLCGRVEWVRNPHRGLAWVIHDISSAASILGSFAGPRRDRPRGTVYLPAVLYSLDRVPTRRANDPSSGSASMDVDRPVDIPGSGDNRTRRAVDSPITGVGRGILAVLVVGLRLQAGLLGVEGRLF